MKRALRRPADCPSLWALSADRWPCRPTGAQCHHPSPMGAGGDRAIAASRLGLSRATHLRHDSRLRYWDRPASGDPTSRPAGQRGHVEGGL